jgi:hypothetical protein
MLVCQSGRVSVQCRFTISQCPFGKVGKVEVPWLLGFVLFVSVSRIHCDVRETVQRGKMEMVRRMERLLRKKSEVSGVDGDGSTYGKTLRKKREKYPRKILY